jgi:hypothetical protein
MHARPARLDETEMDVCLRFRAPARLRLVNLSWRILQTALNLSPAVVL